MPYKPVATLRSKRPRYVSLSEASKMLDGLLSPGTIRDLIRAGRVPGAIQAGRRYFVPRVVVPDLIVDMSAGDPKAHNGADIGADIGWKSRRAHTTYDGPMAV